MFCVSGRLRREVRSRRWTQDGRLRGFENPAMVPNISDLDVRNGGSRMDSLGSLNAFVRAAEAPSFTVAGRQLGVSSSALGKAMGALEERLGLRRLPRRAPHT